MLKIITQILGSFILALAFIFPSVSTPADYLQLYVNPPIKNNVANRITERQVRFGTTLDSGMYYDFYFHYLNPKPYTEKPITLSDFARSWRSLCEYPGS